MKKCVTIDNFYKSGKMGKFGMKNAFKRVNLVRKKVH